MFVKCMFLSITLAIIFSLSACGPKEVAFPDANLEAAIREAIDKPAGSILPSDLEGLTYFDAHLKEITDLSGLEYCTNLTELYLGFNQISDISALSDLANLFALDLMGNQISDISPLLSLTNLASLNVEENPLSTRSLDVYIPQLEDRGVKVNW